MVSDKAKALEHLKTFLSYLQIAREQDVFNGDNSKGKYDEARFSDAVKKMHPFIGAIRSMFDDLGVEYVQTFQHAHYKTPKNIIEMVVKEYPSYPYNEARQILIPKIEGAIFSIEQGYYESKNGSSVYVPDKDFSFISNVKLRGIIENDYREVYKCLVSECYKATMVLAGCLIEAVLLDLLTQNKQTALVSQKAPKGKVDLEKWDLYDLIEVSVDLKLVSGIEKLGHGVRDFRNLIHPGKQLKEDLQVEPEEAKIAIEVLNIIIRQLS